MFLDTGNDLIAKLSGILTLSREADKLKPTLARGRTSHENAQDAKLEIKDVPNTDYRVLNSEIVLLEENYRVTISTK